MIRKYFHIYCTLQLAALAVVIFFFFRLILFISELNRLDDNVPFTDIFYSFFMGLRFDIVISGYILILPFLLLSVSFLSGREIIFIGKFCFYYTVVVFIAAFLIVAADIPYFNHSFSRFSVTAFEWMDNPSFVAGMIAEEPRYWLVFVPFLFISVLFVFAVKKIWRNISDPVPFEGKIFLKYGATVLFLGLMLLGIRGRLDEKSPIRVGTAYFSNNAFLNQLGLNPNFTLIRSYLDHLKEENQPVNFMDANEAIAMVQQQLDISNAPADFPLLREIKPDSFPRNYNVVLIIMESMSAEKMKRHGNEKNLTPFLDSISQRGLYFENIYSSGIHTFNGIFSTLFSFPAVYRQHPMKQGLMLKYNGISFVLKKLGYSTIYFTTHDGQFDNVEGFLLKNDFDKIISKKDYPSDKIQTTLGVPDDFMFEFSIPVLNELDSKNNPFFAAFMTASDHGPYFVPEYFTPVNSELKNQIVEYADWSLKKFIDLSAKQSWFDSTLFVFIADHGAPLDGTYEMPLSYNHVPFLIYNPKIFKEGMLFSGLGGQIDVFPTVMGLLGQRYRNNTLGIDLRREKRPYIFFNGDDKTGVVDHEWFLIAGKDGSCRLHKYRDKDRSDYSLQYPDKVREMKKYAECNLQVYQHLILSGKQFAK